MIFLKAAPREFAPEEILNKTYRQTKLSRSPNKHDEVVVLWFVFSNHKKYISIYSKQCMFNIFHVVWTSR